jgi:hypothetical protein
MRPGGTCRQPLRSVSASTGAVFVRSATILVPASIGIKVRQMRISAACCSAGRVALRAFRGFGCLGRAKRVRDGRVPELPFLIEQLIATIETANRESYAPHVLAFRTNQPAADD